MLRTLAFLRPQVGIFATDGNFATLVGICATCSCNFATKMVILVPRHLLTLAALLPSGKGTCISISHCRKPGSEKTDNYETSLMMKKLQLYMYYNVTTFKRRDNNDDDKNYLHRRMYTMWREKTGLIKENLLVLAMHNGKPNQNHCQGHS